MKKLLIFITSITFIIACQKDDSDDLLGEEIVIETNAGDDFENIKEFQVTLNADKLSDHERGEWSIFSGMEDEKVSFEDKNDPQTIFNGLPGEEYQLIWTVTKGRSTAKDTINVIFSPLETNIENLSLDFYKTRQHLNAKIYDHGIWTIEGGEYQRIESFSSGSSNESPYIVFKGFENKEYKLTWTTWYGSKSASASISFTSKEYQQDEALKDLGILDRPWMYKKDENGNVIEVNLGGDGHGWKIGSLDNNPSIKALKYLKKLDISADGFYRFPEVITSYYLDLEVLKIEHNAISSLPENIGDLKKLDTLTLYNNQDSKKLVSLPESFGELKNLKYLDMSGMGLRNIPESFSNLTELNYLNLELNAIQKLPNDFGNLKKLETFRGPSLDVDIPDSFSNLENLKFCFFTILKDSPSVLPEDIGRLTNLETFWITGKYEYLPDSFGNLSSLKSLKIRGGNRLIELPESFGNLISLESLRVGVRFARFPNSFTNLSNLKFLTIHGSLEYLPVDIDKLTMLEWISVDQNNLKEIPENLGNLANLTYFSAYSNRITEIPASFGNLPRIRELDLSYNSISHFPESIGNLSNTLDPFRIRGNNYSEAEFSRLKELLPTSRVER